MKPLKVIIAGGGTGGHLFPGIAIAREFIKKNSDTKICFLNSGTSFEKKVLSETPFQLKLITASGFKGAGILQKFISVFAVPKGVFQSAKFIFKFKPDIIVGVGGYSSGPVALGARVMGKKLVIHEQNILPGITNKIVSKIANRVYVSFEDTKEQFNPKKTIVTGNPVREEFLRDKKTEKQDKQFNILVLGGSQGAKSINKAVIEALDILGSQDNIFFIHQTGVGREKSVKQAYKERGIKGDIRPFFINMAEPYKRADLVICRAGATTIAEITAIGKAAIFIPFPFAADDHQVLNASVLVNCRASDMIIEKDLTGESLAKKIKYYASNRKTLETMAKKAKKMGRPNAAADIVEDCYKLILG